jgi:hypothetical protein
LAGTDGLLRRKVCAKHPHAVHDQPKLKWLKSSGRLSADVPATESWVLISRPSSSAQTITIQWAKLRSQNSERRAQESGSSEMHWISGVERFGLDSLKRSQNTYPKVRAESKIPEIT